MRGKIGQEINRTPAPLARWMTDMDARGALAGYFASLLTDLERATAEGEG